VEKHFDDLSKKCHERMILLEKVLPLAKEYQDKLTPLEIWLEVTEKKVKDLELVPTDESHIQKSIEKLEVVQKEVSSKEADFKGLTKISSMLMNLVGEDDAKALSDKDEDLNSRYNSLIKKSNEVHQVLSKAKANLRSLVLAYEELLNWMEQTESKLMKYRVLSVFTENLLEQLEVLRTITEEIVSHQVPTSQHLFSLPLLLQQNKLECWTQECF
jgi:hypothetical protein